MTQKEKYSYRASQGLCPKCGKEKNGDKKLCDACRNYLKEYRELYIKHKVCPICKKEPLFGDEKSCPECRVEKLECNSRWKVNNPERAKESHAKSNVKNKAKMRAQGLCYCGRKRGNKMYVYCERCRLKMAEHARLKRDVKNA